MKWIFRGSVLDFANAVVYNKASNLQGFISGKGPSMAARNLKQQAYNVIKEKIINCEFAPGAVYNEEYLCEEVNTSRTPVRDALGRLEPVSYTHLDVYKRQAPRSALPKWFRFRWRAKLRR